MTDWKKQFETKEFDRSTRPAKVCFSWTSLEAFVQEIQAGERQAALSELESWLVDEDVTLKDLDLKEYSHELNLVHRQGRNELREELRAKVQEMKEGR